MKQVLHDGRTARVAHLSSAIRRREAIAVYQGAVARLCRVLSRFASELDWEALHRPEVLIEFERRFDIMVGDVCCETRRARRVLASQPGDKANELEQELRTTLADLTRKMRPSLRCLDRDAALSSDVLLRARMERARLAALPDATTAAAADVETALIRSAEVARTGLKNLIGHCTAFDELAKEASVQVERAEQALIDGSSGVLGGSPLKE